MSINRMRKLYLAVLANPRRVISFADFCDLLVSFDFALRRQEGSHRIYRHPDVARPLPVQPRGKDAKPYQLAQFLDMVQEHGLKQR
jgi:predicted RNA binding protein YcfA (HicA-like mRNA interferase family)